MDSKPECGPGIFHMWFLTSEVTVSTASFNTYLHVLQNKCKKGKVLHPLPNQLSQIYHTSIKVVFIMNKIIRCEFYCNITEHFQKKTNVVKYI